ncbi:flagellar FlbD family protein [Paenibacillus sp. OV219]|uniref:flagellar FlbD family protein n=1 Tax=Paenibacillus sp. OV219 TaxID=1884377 RepID=UPI0008C52B58|nr:flagellar FlbD family protein [Paenibacillus sp. OV219]SEN32193.1 flagellar protein FlbD [Paenibacillus sp. OV219]
MIAVTRLNGKSLHINALLIELVEETPDTLITMTTGKKILVLEKATEVISSIQSYLRSIGVYAATLKSDQTEGPSQ